MKQSDQTQMGTMGRVLVASTLVAVLAVAGCGGSGASRSSSPLAKSAATTTASRPTTTTTTTVSPSPPRSAIELQIPVLLPYRFLPERYTCDGADLSIPLRWERVPRGTAELALFILDERPGGMTSIDWAVAGLSSALSGITAGRLPAGAVVGRNSFGKDAYSICPEHGQEQIYIVALFALSHRLPLKEGFDAAALHEQVERLARVQGLTSARYKRP